MDEKIGIPASVTSERFQEVYNASPSDAMHRNENCKTSPRGCEVDVRSSPIWLPGIRLIHDYQMQLLTLEGTTERLQCHLAAFRTTLYFS